MSIFIEGFAIANYRSFGNDLQKIGPLAKLNLFIGQNNSGKSNVLRFVKDHLVASLSATNGAGKNLRFSNLDQHMGRNGGVFRFGLALDPKGEKYNTWLEENRAKLNGRHIRDLSSLLTSSEIAGAQGIVWFEYSYNGTVLIVDRQIVGKLLKSRVLDNQSWYGLWSALTEKGRGDIEQHWIPETLAKLSPNHHKLPDVHLVPAVRRVEGSDLQSASDLLSGELSGVGLIERLAKLQNPAVDEQSSRAQFNAINTFLQEVIGHRSATIEIPHNRQTIVVHMDDRSLPLESLGTGVHEVVILAAAATVVTNCIMCIEEPELHLHPLLQKKLVRYLVDNTDNQYFITTHSAHLLDTPNAAIFHVRHQNGCSTVEYVSTPSDRSRICTDLGYRASDLMQANCVIWVEGPSDRIYLNHWVQAVDPTLVEGIHYSIMFYGGRLLSHLTAYDPEVSEFISLRRLNRYICILMDSDKKFARAHINKTKKRLKIEFDNGSGFAWVTKGREIENYVPQTLLEAAVKSVYSNAERLAHTGEFDHALHFVTADGKTVIDTVDKIKVAHAVTTYVAELDVLDLKYWVNKVVKFIQEANDGVSQPE